jgi:phosphate transport system ATP-binding protein
LTFTHRSPSGVPQPIIDLEDVTVRYRRAAAVSDVTLDIEPGRITALIGPSGCGKSTLLRTINRMNESIEGVRVSGTVRYRGQDLYAPGIDPVEVRRHIGMVFQKPNPFALSIADNVAFGPRLHRRRRRGLAGTVETALRRAALWDEVRDHLDAPALALSGGQQQRLCIARALATDPEVLLLDEPCSALDPIATLRIEDLLRELRNEITIILVTHNLQQAARVSDTTVFLSADLDPLATDRSGRVIEVGPTERIFTAPRDPRTEAYVTGRYG